MSVQVVHVCAYFAPAFVYGGPPRSVLRLCQAQQSAGLDVRVITTAANGAGDLPPAVSSLRSYDGVPVVYCPRAWPRAIFRAPQLRREVADALASADLLHIHGLWNAAVWAAHRAARNTSRPYVLSPRGMLEPAALAHDAWRKRLAYPWFERRLVRDAALLHATSPAELATLERRFGPRRAVCVPNGVDVMATAVAPQQVRAQFRLPSQGPLILFLGRIHPLKRLDLLAAAFIRLRGRHPDAHLVIAGPDETGARTSLELMLASVRESVTWTGAVDEPGKHALLSACSALVLCSDSESFGLSVAEAMAAAAPVVVTRTCPWPEVETERTGYWVEQTAPAIADALSRLLEDPAAAREMGRRGRALVEARYTWPRVAAALTVEYERVLSAESA